MRGCPKGVRLEYRPCPNGCPSSDKVVLEGGDRLHNLPGIFRVVRCKQCDLMRTDPRPTPDTIGAYYPDDYGPYQTAEATEPVGHGIKKKLSTLLGLPTRVLPPVQVGRMLELGCANGAWLSQMARAGWKVEGIEFSAEAARHASDRGLKVQVASVETAQAPDEPVDVVAAWMVLEHLHEPVSALRRLRDWVKPNGWLVASVPDASSLERVVFGSRWYDLHLPNHLYHYSPKSISSVLRSAGWELVQVRWQCNANNLLWSLCYLAEDRHWHKIGRALHWLRTSRASSKLRTLLAILLGVTRQSGRIEIWARPLGMRGSTL